MGLDDVLHPWFQQHSLAAQQACIQQGSIAGCRAILQQGGTPGLRPQLWSTALAVQLPDDQIEQCFQQLCGQAEQCHLLTDLLVTPTHLCTTAEVMLLSARRALSARIEGRLRPDMKCVLVSSAEPTA